LGTLNLVLRAELRRRWRSWLALAELIAVGEGFVMAAAAAGRRTAAAFPRYIHVYGYDESVYSFEPLTKLAELPAVGSVTPVRGAIAGHPHCRCTHPISINAFGVGFVSPGSKPVVKLVSGREPAASSPDEVLASFTLQKDKGLRLGSVITVPFYAPSVTCWVAK
jgi:hypothetical protein